MGKVGAWRELSSHAVTVKIEITKRQRQITAVKISAHEPSRLNLVSAEIFSFWPRSGQQRLTGSYANENDTGMDLVSSKSLVVSKPSPSNLLPDLPMEKGMEAV